MTRCLGSLAPLASLLPLARRSLSGLLKQTEFASIAEREINAIDPGTHPLEKLAILKASFFLAATVVKRHTAADRFLSAHERLFRCLLAIRESNARNWRQVQRAIGAWSDLAR